VNMDFLATRLQSQLSSVVRYPPRHQVQNVLSQLPAGPLVPVDDGQIQRHHTKTFAADAVTFDAFVTVAGPGEDPLRPPEQLVDVGHVGRQNVLKRPPGTSHRLRASL
jgi:hypothetical protein